MHETDGDTVTTGTANVAELNEWSGTNEVQTISMSGTATGGTFTLSFAGSMPSGNIAHNAAADDEDGIPTNDVEGALEALSTVGIGNVQCTGGPLPGTPVTVTFTGFLGSMNVGAITANSSLMPPGTTVNVAETIVGAPGNWKNDRMRLDLEGRLALAGSVPWTLPAVDGVKIVTHGYGQPRGEDEFTTGSYQAGMLTGFAWVDETNNTGPMIRLVGYGGEMGHFRVDGNINASLTGLIAEDPDNRKDTGIELQDMFNGGYGVGKYHFESLCTNFCKVGMAVTAPSFGADNGDETRIDVFRPEYCDVGFLSQHIQAQGFTFGYAVQAAGVKTMWKYEQGSFFHCEDFLAGTGDPVRGLYITGTDAVAGNAGGFVFNYVQIDDLADDEYRVVEINPNQVQTIQIFGTVTDGTFKLTDGVQETSNINHDDSAATIQMRLEADLTAILPGDIICTGGPLHTAPVTVTFTSKFRHTDVLDLSVTSPNLVGGGSVAAFPGRNQASIVIHHLRASHNHGTDKEMFLLKNHYGQLTINSGENLRAGLIEVTGGTSTLLSTVRIKNAKFKVGADLSTIREYFTNASRGYVQVIVKDNAEEHGAGGSGNSGKTYPDFSGVIEIYGNGQNDFDIISGGPAPHSGVYTPVVVNVTNANNPTAAECQYLRVGDSVTVSGKVNVTPIMGTSTLTQFSISLPVSSDLGSNVDCSGTAASAASNESGIILGDPTSNKAWMQFYPTTTNARDMYFTFTYQVIPF
jgi:hypothetical protein